MDRTLELIKKSQEGDTEAKEIIVKENIGLVYSVVKRFRNRGYEIDDLIQLGSIGLIRSIDNFNFKYDVKFSTYAIPMIIGEIKRFLRDDGIIKVSRSLKIAKRDINNFEDKYINEYNRKPTIREISEELNIKIEDILLARESMSEVESLNKVVYENDGSTISLMDRLGENKCTEKEVLNNVLLKEVMSKLNEKEKKIIVMRYFRDKTQGDIANILGTSQVQVSRAEKRILDKLRKMI